VGFFLFRVLLLIFSVAQDFLDSETQFNYVRHFYTSPDTEGGRLRPDVRPHAILDVSSPAAAAAAVAAADDAATEENGAAPIIKRSKSRRLRAAIFSSSVASSNGSTCAGDSYSTRGGTTSKLRWDRFLYQRHLAALACRAVIRGDVVAAAAAAAAHSPGLRLGQGKAPSIAFSDSHGEDWWEHEGGSEAETPRRIAAFQTSALLPAPAAAAAAAAPRRAPTLPPPNEGNETARTTQSDWSCSSQVEYVAHC
jgi:hypothetical protein